MSNPVLLNNTGLFNSEHDDAQQLYTQYSYRSSYHL